MDCSRFVYRFNLCLWTEFEWIYYIEMQFCRHNLISDPSLLIMLNFDMLILPSVFIYFTTLGLNIFLIYILVYVHLNYCCFRGQRAHEIWQFIMLAPLK